MVVATFEVAITIPVRASLVVAYAEVNDMYRTAPDLDVGMMKEFMVMDGSWMILDFYLSAKS